MASAGDRAVSQSITGDVNGDGIDDALVGAVSADVDVILAAGSYAVFGKRHD